MLLKCQAFQKGYTKMKINEINFEEYNYSRIQINHGSRAIFFPEKSETAVKNTYGEFELNGEITVSESGYLILSVKS